MFRVGINLMNNTTNGLYVRNTEKSSAFTYINIIICVLNLTSISYNLLQTLLIICTFTHKCLWKTLLNTYCWDTNINCCSIRYNIWGIEGVLNHIFCHLLNNNFAVHITSQTMNFMHYNGSLSAPLSH